MSGQPSPENNIINYLARVVREQPGRKALVYPLSVDGRGNFSYKELTFAELDERVSRLASSLRGLGLRPGDRVVVMVPMSIELYVLILALLKMGAISMFVGPWQGFDQVARSTEFVEPSAFIGVLPAHVLRLYSGVFRRIPIKVVSGSRGLFGEERLERLIAEGRPYYPVEPVRAEDTALITFTTGSTGIPKGVNRTHGLLVAQHLSLARHLGMTAEDVDLPAFPVLVLNNLAMGVTSVVPKFKPTRPADVRPEWILRQVRDHGVTTAAGSPAYFQRIARYCLKHGQTLDTLRLLFTGGAPVPPGLLEMLVQAMPNGTPYVVYGSTEAEPVSLFAAAQVLQETAAATRQGQGNCVGQPVAGVQLKIIRAQPGPVEIPEGWAAVELPQGQIGEIVVTGDHVGKDYYRNPEAVRAIKIRAPDGTIWHRMGDVGYLDGQGRVWLTGRVHNIVNSGGRHFYPVMAEAIVQQLTWVRRAALLGLPGAPAVGEGRAVATGSSPKGVLPVPNEVRMGAAAQPESTTSSTDDGADGERVCIVVEPAERSPLLRRLRRKEWAAEVIAHCALYDLPVDEVFFTRAIPVDPRHNSKIEYEALRRTYRHH